MRRGQPLGLDELMIVNPQEASMGRVKGVKEKLHLPVYDAFFVPGAVNGTPARTFESVMADPRVIRFFVDVQNKTKLETNLQAAGVLPSLNTFEARAMRVVVSSLFEEARIPSPGGPPNQQVAEPNFLAELIYNSVTSLLVGEKVMIEMPTFWYPAGAGITGQFFGVVFNHGEADPMATFRFAEPVLIEPQQNFRVEMLFPRGVPDRVRHAIGPFHIWVVLDGYLTRDVQ
jgi:hypothetical protein